MIKHFLNKKTVLAGFNQLKWSHMCALRRTFLMGESPLICPSSGKDTAKTKGVHCEVESEGRWRQISGLTNRNYIRL